MPAHTIAGRLNLLRQPGHMSQRVLNQIVQLLPQRPTLCVVNSEHYCLLGRLDQPFTVHMLYRLKPVPFQLTVSSTAKVKAFA